MNLIKDYRPDGLEVILDDASVVELMVIRNNPRIGIIARVKGQGRVILWSDGEAHADDTEEQFVAQLKTVI